MTAFQSEGELFAQRVNPMTKMSSLQSIMIERNLFGHKNKTVDSCSVLELKLMVCVFYPNETTSKTWSELLMCSLHVFEGGSFVSCFGECSQCEHQAVGRLAACNSIHQLWAFLFKYDRGGGMERINLLFGSSLSSWSV